MSSFAKVEKEYETPLGKMTVAFLVPQADNHEELIGPNFYTSDEVLVERSNKVIARGAIAGGNALLKAAIEEKKINTQEEWNELVKKALDSAKGYKPEITTGVSAKAAKASVDSLKDFRTKHADLFKQLNVEQVMDFLDNQVLPDAIVAELAKREAAAPAAPKAA